VLSAPLMVSAMTGGTAQAALINERLAAAAAAHGIGLALGSGRALLRDPSLAATYVGRVRPPLLFANLGGSQLLEPRGVDDARRLVELLDADGLSLHLNALQEAIQPEGQTDFSGLATRIGELVRALDPIPVIVKEVGFGMSSADARLLMAAGVAGIDVAGSGGTNWALVEGDRDPAAAAVASAFAGWGVPTAEALVSTLGVTEGRIPVLASGGLRTGVDVALCLALGAVAGGLARQLLLAAQSDSAEEAIGVLIRQLRIATWLAGAPSSAALTPELLRPTGLAT
jgi:isopentenyl-diphosphate delta-isomerase